MDQRSAAFRFGPVLGTLTFLAMLGAQPAWGQGNSDAAHWCAANFPPAQRGQCVSQAAHGSGPFSICGPGGTNVGLCGGAGGVCCAASEVCAANACATPTPTVTPTSTNTDTPTPTPTSTATDTPTPTPTHMLVVGESFDGIDFNVSSCGCLPPDTTAAVGGNYILETVNVQCRIFDKTTGSILLDEPLSTFFGQASGGDPYAVYDDIANRWYVSAFDNSDSGLLLAVSNDGNPLDGFNTYHLTNVGGLPNFNKIGFNRDAIFISYNDFGGGGSGGAAVASIDKTAILAGTLTYYVSHPNFQFQAMPPAQMHGDMSGGVEWFVSTDGTDQSGNTIRVTEMTNYLSGSPTFTYTSLPVAPYKNAPRADQPGGSVTTDPNTTTTQVQYRNGHLVTAMASGTATDGFTYPKGLYYRVDVSSGTPVLLQQGVIDPGMGVAVQMPTVAEDILGNLGFTWMESSSSEFLSMWVGTLHTSGHFASVVAAPGGGFFTFSFRIGDYSSTVVDPADGTTFWAANEYIGSDGSSDIWRTHITSFSSPP